MIDQRGQIFYDRQIGVGVKRDPGKTTGQADLLQSMADIAFGLEKGMVSDPTYDETATKGLGYWLVRVVEKDATKGAHVKGMLLGSRQQAEEIRAWIEAGEDFGALATKYSQDQASGLGGGDMGWILQAGKTQADAVTNRVVVSLASQLHQRFSR